MHLSLSNGGTSVLLTTVLLSGSHLACEPWQRELLFWLAERDQSILGLGLVGFDLSELPWDTARFEEQKRFLLGAFELALQEFGWERLDYRPPLVKRDLQTLQSMVKAFQQEHLQPRKQTFPITSDSGSLCPTHRVLLSEFGCLVCNDL